MLDNNLLRYKFDQEYIGFDYETCNLCISHEDINLPWQLGTQKYKGKNLIESREDWIKWDFPFEVGYGAAEITGFTWDKYHAKARPAKPILDRFEKSLYDPKIINVFTNGVRFDTYMHKIFRKLCGKEIDWSYQKRSICVQNLEKAILLNVKLPAIGTDDWVSYNNKLSNYFESKRGGIRTSLQTLCKRYDIPYDHTRHHVEALYDVELMFAVLWKQMYLLEI